MSRSNRGDVFGKAARQSMRSRHGDGGSKKDKSSRQLNRAGARKGKRDAIRSERLNTAQRRPPTPPPVRGKPVAPRAAPRSN